MNKIFLIILQIALFAEADGQYNFGIKSNSEWKIDKLINVKSKKDNRCNGDETYRMFVKDDTVINSVVYHKIYKSGTLYLDVPQEYTDLYCGAIRESGSQWYYVEKLKDSEQLLYDFDLKIGDTLKGLIANGKIVVKIDTLSNGRKQIYISKSMLHAMDAYIIEGIGSSGGLLNEPPVGHYMFNDSYLICYTENKETEYIGIDPLNNGCGNNSSRFPINPNGVWDIRCVSFCTPNVFKQGDDIFQYYFDNDTVINGFKYFKMYKSGVAYYTEPFYYERIYVGAIRDGNNKFYFIDKSESSEKTLFDFDLMPGDTIKTYIGKGNVVSRVETLFDGRRKIYYGHEICAGCCPVSEIIEGIGHAGGIIEPPPCFHPCAQGYYLVCYSENNISVYSNDYGLFNSVCGKNTSIPYESESNSLKISPVPVKDMLTIEFNKPVKNNITIAVYDIEGRMFMDQKLHLDGNTNKLRLNLSYLNKGMYIIKINNMNSNICRKIVKD